MVSMSLIIVYFDMFYRVPEASLQELVNANYYLNLNEYATNFDIAMQIKSVAFLLWSLKFLGGLNFTTSMIFFFRILEKTYKEIVGFLIFLMVITIGISFVIQQHFGIYILDCNSLLTAFYTFFGIIFLGNTQDLTDMKSFNYSLTSILIILYTLLVMSIFLGYLLCIITEAVRYITIYEASLFEQETLYDILLQLADKALAKFQAFKEKMVSIIPSFSKKKVEESANDITNIDESRIN